MTKNNSCQYCGNNPTPHFFHWYFESLNVLLTPVRQILLYNPASLAVARLISRLHAEEKILQGAVRFGLLSENMDRSLCRSPRAQVLWEDAEHRGIQLFELRLLGRGIDVYRASKDGHSIVFSGLPRPEDKLNRKLLDQLDDKWFFKRRLMEAGLPAAAGGCVTAFSQAKKIFETIQKPVIVKPRAGSRGRHSITYIYNLDQLKEAFQIAKQLCYWVIVEEQLFGPVYRATIIDGQLVGVLRGDSPQVAGDGQHTIAELVTTKNAAPHPGVKDIQLDDRAAAFLRRQGFTFESIPLQGQIVYLSEKVGVNYGGSSSEDFDICHEDTKALFVAAGRAINDPIVGFDFIIPDITKSWKEQRCGFLEANSLPFINLHHEPLLGQPRNVAAAVWQMVGM